MLPMRHTVLRVEYGLPRVKPGLMVTYLRGISNGFTEFITNRVLYPPSVILLWSTVYTYLTLGSWECDVGHAEKQKRKIFFFSFFGDKPFLIRRLVLQIHLYTLVLGVGAV